MLRSAKVWDCQSIHLVPVLGDRKIMVAITELDMISEMGRSSRCRKNYLDREVRG